MNKGNLTRAARIFDLIAPIYGLFHRSLEDNYRKAVAILQEHCPISRETRVLDVGTGTGALAGAFSELTPHVTGIDLSEKMLSSAQRRYRAKARFLKMAAHELDRFEAREFDVVAAAFMLHHYAADYRRQVLRQMKRVARQKVMIIDFIPHQSRLMAFLETLEGSHYREFMPDFANDLADVFPSYQVVEFSVSSGVYLCDPE